MRRKKYITRKEIKEMKKRWREALATPTKPLHDPVPLGEIIDEYLEGKELCEDCISREAVQNYVESHIQEINTGYGDLNKHTNEILRMIVDYIEKMESVTPQPEKHTEERTKTHACDCISRQAVLDMVEDMTDQFGNKHRVVTEGMINLLPPVTPKSKTDVLDKIRAEIEHLTITEGGEDYVRKMVELCSLKFKVLQIIDKYMTEKE